jgi:hypothetical protein
MSKNAFWRITQHCKFADEQNEHSIERQIAKALHLLAVVAHDAVDLGGRQRVLPLAGAPLSLARATILITRPDANPNRTEWPVDAASARNIHRSGPSGAA